MQKSPAGRYLNPFKKVYFTFLYLFLHSYRLISLDFRSNFIIFMQKSTLGRLSDPVLLHLASKIYRLSERRCKS